MGGSVPPMADFLVMREFQGPSFQLRAGTIIDDGNYNVSRLQQSGLITVDFQAAMLPIIQQFLLDRGTDDSGSDLAGGLQVAGLLGAPALAQRVIVQALSDLPPPSGGSHQLVANTVYQFNGQTTSADALAMPSSTIVIGESSGRDGFIYTGTGTAIVITPDAGTLPTIRNMRIEATAGLGIDVQGTVNFVLDGCTIDANEIATIDATQGIVITECLFSGFGRGITLTGTPLRVSMSVTAFFQATGGSGNPCLDLGTTVVGSANFSVLRCFTAAGGIGLNGAAPTATTGAGASPNISVGNVGKVVDSLLGGAGTPLVGITNEDIRWVFADAIGVEDSVDLGDILIEPGNTTATVITDQGADGDTVGWVRVAGTTVPVFESHLEQTANNELTYNTEQSQKLGIQFCVVLEMVTGGATNLEVGIGVNGTINTFTVVPTTPSASERRTVSCAFVRSFTQGDTIEVQVRNLGNTVNVLVHAMHLVVGRN